MTDQAIYTYVPHQRTRSKLEGHPDRPVTVAGQLPTGNAVARFNAWFAVKVTNGVGTMWCAYAFAAIALISLPQAISAHSTTTLVSWVSQTFLQLVLPSVIICRSERSGCRRRQAAEATTTMPTRRFMRQ